MKAVEIEELSRGVPEVWGTEPVRVLRAGLIVGVFYPLRACRYLSERTRRDLWRAVFESRALNRGLDGLSDEEITRDLMEAGREPERGSLT